MRAAATFKIRESVVRNSPAPAYDEAEGCRAAHARRRRIPARTRRNALGLGVTTFGTFAVGTPAPSCNRMTPPRGSICSNASDASTTGD